MQLPALRLGLKTQRGTLDERRRRRHISEFLVATL
jgi:hypothetical protein